MDLFQVFKNMKFSSALLFLHIYISMIKIIMKRLMRNTIFSKCKNQKKTFLRKYLSPTLYLFPRNSEFFRTATFLLYFYTLSD